MSLEKESLTHKIEDDLALRNRNWDKLTSHLAESVTGAGGAHGFKVEEGNFTPYIYGETTAGSPTLTTRTGTYYKVGKLVYLTLVLKGTAKGGMAGNLIVGGFPFVNEDVKVSLNGEIVNGITNAVLIDFLPQIYPNSNNMRLRGNTKNSAGAISGGSLRGDQLGDSFEFWITGVYKTN